MREKTLASRFMNKWKKEGKCWIWTAFTNNKGYGVLNVNGRATLAHRAGYELMVKKIPKGKCLLHSCDNPLCVNPSHLFIGTQQDNMKDMYKKGRTCLGENRTQAKLTLQKAKEIREIYKLGEHSQRTLAKMFDISQPIICDLINNKRWI